jgi:hypothetical protein
MSAVQQTRCRFDMQPPSLNIHVSQSTPYGACPHMPRIRSGAGHGVRRFPLGELLHKLRNVEFVLAEVTGLDAEQRRVLARRPLGGQIEFGYDYLILAAGVRQSYSGHDEYAAFARDENRRGRPEDPAADIRCVRDGRIRRRSGGTPGAGSPSPWGERDRPGSNWPGRSVRSPPRRWRHDRTAGLHRPPSRIPRVITQIG